MHRRKKHSHNKHAKNFLKPTLSTQAALVAEVRNLGQKFDSLTELVHSTRRDIGGWTSIRTANADPEANEVPWHGSGNQPKSELTNQIWVVLRPP